MKESPLFVRLHGLLCWLLQTTRRFPRDQRFILAQRVMGQAFALEDALVAASVDRKSVAEHLVKADRSLTGLRRTLLLCAEMGYLTDRQYRHVSTLVAEVGKLLGGWRRSLK